MEAQIKPGYKQTEVGVIPQDWDVKLLHSIAEKIMVGIASAATHAYRDRGVVLFRNQNIKPGYLDDSDILFISPDYENTFKNKRLQPGDLLTARTGYPGTTCIVPKRYKDSQSFTTLITRPNCLLVKPNYLSHYINSEQGQKYFDQNQIGGGQKNVNASSLKILPVPLPPTLEEQERIANALSNVDGLIEGLQRLIDKKRLMKQGAMQELLTGRKRLPEFDKGQGYKQTDVGVIPEDWNVVSMGEVGTSLIGLTYSPNDVREYGTLVLRSSNIQNGKLTFNDNVFVDVDLPERVITKEGDLLICVRNGSRQLIGKCVLIDRATAGSAFGAFMSVYRSQLSYFIFYQFQSSLVQSQINERMGATINQITNKDLASFKILLPPTLEEQEAIATTLSDMDNELEALEGKLAKYRQIKQGMMQELLTGKTRLVEPSPGLMDLTGIVKNAPPDASVNPASRV